MSGLVRGPKPRVEYDPGWGWIARRANGDEVWPDFVWATRSIARDVARQADDEDRALPNAEKRHG